MITPVLPRREQRERLPHSGRRWLLGHSGRWWEYLRRPMTPLDRVWAEHRDAVLARHVRHWPGTRPVRWWTYDAPGQRARLGGTGTAWNEWAPCGPSFEYGVPAYWCRQGGSFPAGAVPIDPRDPPRFEAQATFLQRLGLLLPGEGKRLTEADFEPECIL
jgi:hypothetical protein